MPPLARFRSTVRWLARRGHMEAELDDEFRDRWEREVEQCERRYAARRSQTGGRRAIGPASLYKEECRDARGAGLSAMLYGVSPRDPATYVVAIALMAVVAFAASWNPAARAVHVDPAQTLRER